MIRRIIAKKKEKKRRQEAVERNKNSQPKISNFVVNKSKFPLTDEAKDQIDYSLMQYIVKDHLPLSTVESPSFRKLMYTLEPRYIAPSRRKLTDRCDRGAERWPKYLGAQIKEDQDDTDFKVNLLTYDFSSAF